MANSAWRSEPPAESGGGGLVSTIDDYHTPGRFGWTGDFGTTAYTDPAHAMISIFFKQLMMVSPEPPKVFTDFWTLAYTACVDPLTTSAT